MDSAIAGPPAASHSRLTAPENSQIVNISRSGMHFRTETRFTVGKEIGVGIKDPHRDRSLVLKGKVVRVDEPPKGAGLKGVAVEFLDVPPREQGILEEMSRNHQANHPCAHNRVRT